MSLDKSKSTLKNLIAGGTAGAIEACIMYPTEYVKTQLQLDAIKRVKSGSSQAYSGIIDCAVKTVRSHGILGLYRGLSSLVVGSIPKASLRFAAFHRLSNKLKDSNGNLSSHKAMLAGLGAGAIEAIGAVTPMETIKTQLISDQNSAKPKYRGLMHGVSCMIKENGIAGIYRGVVPTTLKQSCNQAVRFSVYTRLKDLLTVDKKDITFWQSLILGSIAGFTSVYATMPFDVVKTQMQGFRYKSSLDCAKFVYGSSGISAFWKGTVPRLGRCMCSSSIIFASYEEVMKIMLKCWPEE